LAGIHFAIQYSLFDIRYSEQLRCPPVPQGSTYFAQLIFILPALRLVRRSIYGGGSLGEGGSLSKDPKPHTLYPTSNPLNAIRCTLYAINRPPGSGSVCPAPNRAGSFRAQSRNLFLIRYCEARRRQAAAIFLIIYPLAMLAGLSFIFSPQ
jgi:hypothetical protein